MEGEDILIYRHCHYVKVPNDDWNEKTLTITSSHEGYKITLQDSEDIFDYKTITITLSDYDYYFKQKQNIKAHFKEFPGLLIGMLLRVRNPSEVFYLCLSENPTSLMICEITVLKTVKHLEILLTNGSIEEIKQNIEKTIVNQKEDLMSLKHTIQSLEETITYYEQNEELLKMENFYLSNSQLQIYSFVKDLECRNQQKTDEIQKMYMEMLHRQQKEKDEEIKSLKVTNQSLNVLNGLLETKNTSIKNKLQKEHQLFCSAIQAKKEIDKDRKILKAKITKYIQELNEFHGQVPKLETEISNLNKIVKENEKFKENYIREVKAHEKSVQELEECKTKMYIQEERIELLSRRIDDLKSEVSGLKRLKALVDDKAKISASKIDKLKTALKNIDALLETKNKEINSLVSKNELLQGKVLYTEYKMEHMLKCMIPNDHKEGETNSDNGLTAYLNDKFQK